MKVAIAIGVPLCVVLVLSAVYVHWRLNVHEDRIQHLIEMDGQLITGLESHSSSIGMIGQTLNSLTHSIEMLRDIVAVRPSGDIDLSALPHGDSTEPPGVWIANQEGEIKPDFLLNGAGVTYFGPGYDDLRSVGEVRQGHEVIGAPSCSVTPGDDISSSLCTERGIMDFNEKTKDYTKPHVFKQKACDPRRVTLEMRPECGQLPSGYATEPRLTELEPDPCLAKMEAAMRTMDGWLTPRESAVDDSYDGCNHCGSTGCTLVACSGGSAQELRRLEWEVAQVQQRVEREKQYDEALKQWANVKRECWKEQP